MYLCSVALLLWAMAAAAGVPQALMLPAIAVHMQADPRTNGQFRKATSADMLQSKQV